MLIHVKLCKQNRDISQNIQQEKIPNFAAKKNDANFKNSEDKNQNLQIHG